LLSFAVVVTRCHYALQAGLELTVFLSQPPKCRNYKYVPPTLALLCFQPFKFLKKIFLWDRHGADESNSRLYFLISDLGSIKKNKTKEKNRTLN
jgi:hypothetical protein